MGLLTTQFHQCTLESWKSIIENATIIDGVIDITKLLVYSKELEKTITINITANVNVVT